MIRRPSAYQSGARPSPSSASAAPHTVIPVDQLQRHCARQRHCTGHVHVGPTHDAGRHSSLLCFMPLPSYSSSSRSSESTSTSSDDTFLSNLAISCCRQKVGHLLLQALVEPIVRLRIIVQLAFNSLSVPSLCARARRRDARGNGALRRRRREIEVDLAVARVAALAEAHHLAQPRRSPRLVGRRPRIMRHALAFLSGQLHASWLCITEPYPSGSVTSQPLCDEAVLAL